MRHREALETASTTSQVTALSLLVSMYLQSVYAASSEEIEIFLSPVASRSRVREAVRGLSATRQIHSLSMDAQTYYFLENGLPEFAALAAPSAPAEAEASRPSLRAETQAEKDPGNGSPGFTGRALFRIGSHLPPDQTRRVRTAARNTPAPKPAPPSPQPVQDGKHPPDPASRAGLHGSQRLVRRQVERVGPEKIGHARRRQLASGIDFAAPVRARARRSSTLCQTGHRAPDTHPRQAGYSRWNPAESTRRMEWGWKTRETQTLGTAGEEVAAPPFVLRAPAAEVMRRSAPHRSTGTNQVQIRPKRVLHRSSRARHAASADPATRAGHDRRQAGLQAVLKVALQVALQDLRPLTGPIVRRLPIGRTKRAVARRAAEKGAVGLRARRPARRPQASQIQRSQVRQSETGARSGAPRAAGPGPAPSGPGGIGRDARPRPNPRGPDNERPRPAGYARPGGKPGPGGAGKGRSDRRRERPAAALCPRV